MAVRSIPKNHLFVTGGYASNKNQSLDGFESPLEKEFLMLLDFDKDVESFDVQPVRIPVSGVPNGYVPDVLVRYIESSGRRPLLAEVKHSSDLKRHATKYKPKFAAARQYASDQGWEFCVIDEVDIRTPRLTNLKFLREFRNVEVAQAELDHILRRAQALNEALTVSSLADALSSSLDDRLRWLPLIWSMVLRGHLGVEIDLPFGQDVSLQMEPVRS